MFAIEVLNPGRFWLVGSKSLGISNAIFATSVECRFICRKPTLYDRMQFGYLIRELESQMVILLLILILIRVLRDVLGYNAGRYCKNVNKYGT